MSATRTSMRELVTIGQTWRRKRDGQVYRVRQVWRTDRIAGLISEDGTERLQVPLSDLRRLWRLER